MNIRTPLKTISSSFRRKPESSIFNKLWTPAFAGVTFLELSILLLFIFFLFGSTEAASADISKIEQTYQSTKTLQAEFIQTTRVEVLDKTIQRPGRIFYEKGGKLRIEYGANPMTHYISDGKRLWIWYPKDKKMDVYDLKNSGISEEALYFLTGLGELQKHFSVTEKANVGLILKPKKKTFYTKLICKFDEENYLSEMTLHTKSGNQSRYRFFNRTVNAKLPPLLFTTPIK